MRSSASPRIRLEATRAGHDRARQVAGSQKGSKLSLIAHNQGALTALVRPWPEIDRLLSQPPERGWSVYRPLCRVSAAGRYLACLSRLLAMRRHPDRVLVMVVAMIITGYIVWLITAPDLEQRFLSAILTMDRG